MSKIIGVLLFSLFLWNCGDKEVSGLYVKAVENPIMNINGVWHINTSPEKEFWKQNEIDTISWSEIQVPGEVMMQGFSIKNDAPFAYKKEISIPLDYKDNDIYLQFDGVYSYARVWVNGNFVREHHGGFTRWKCDISSYVKAGENALLTVEVTDRSDDISYASGYAKHQIGGILRDVNLLSLPKNYIEKTQVETHFDDTYKNAELIVSGSLKRKGTNSKVTFQLIDKHGNIIAIENKKFVFNGNKEFLVKNTIINPEKWDAEHPNLYTLRTSFYENNEMLWSDSKSIGFREVKVNGNQLLVNGKPVKLRGACRHDVHPTLGRIATPEYELKDVLLAKEANMNFIRTTHYPPSDNFLKLCDEYGIYVEDETAVCFVIDRRMAGYDKTWASQSDPNYTSRYLSQLEEMVDEHRNHPSVIIWSIGNENVFGSNFQKSYDWVKQNDTTRPVMFSYPHNVPEGVKAYDIYSSHYPTWDGTNNRYPVKLKDFQYEGMPALFDEWTHVASYNNETITEDPNIRNFWGQSMDRMWTNIFEVEGGLGGAIWGMIDETFMLPEDLEGFRDSWGINESSVLPYQGETVGYGEWGIMDVWRRKKPEFWNTKKAYSPIKILQTTFKNDTSETAVSIPVYNRFDHTNLNEVLIKYSYKGETKELKGLDLAPHKKGKLILPISHWEVDEKIGVNFYDSNDQLIDSYNIKQEKEEEASNVKETFLEKISIEDKENILTVHTNTGDLFFDKHTGLLSQFEKDGEKHTIYGPIMTYRTEGKKLNYSTSEINDYGQDWKLDQFNFKLEDTQVTVAIAGSYKEIKADFELQISVNGKIKTSYTYKNLPKEYVREVGVKYNFDAIFDSLFWEKESYWSSYPENHIGAATGKVPLYSKILNKYRVAPEKKWNQDIKSFYYEGTESEQGNTLTRIAKATKENCIEYSLLKNNKKWITVQGKKNTSCRLAKKDSLLELYLNSKVDYFNLNWGNYERNILLDSSFAGEVELALSSN